MADGICSVEGCDRNGRLISGWCVGHYTRWARTGDVGRAELRAPRKKIERGAVCSVESCDRPVSSNGWCKAHASRWERHGDVQADVLVGPSVKEKRRTPCSIEGCERNVASGGMCSAHHYRRETYGDPLGGKPVGGPSRGVCSLGGCDDPHYIGGYCIRHDYRVRRYGSLDGGQFEFDPVVLAGRGKSATEKFWQRVIWDGPVPEARPRLGSCWLWKLSHNGNGYGQTFLFPKIAMGAHRVAWHLSGYTLIDGMELDHLCRNPGCLRPTHLEQVPPAVNNYRSNSWAGRNIRKTRCSSGHEFTPENTRLNEAGHRTCRRCSNDKIQRLAAERALSREDRAIARAYRALLATRPCFYCGRQGEAVDHYIPISKNGSAAWWNLFRSCRSCNSSKGVRCGTWFVLKRGVPQS